jgi:pimeloyl-ACP methyl ester carboxylesterase
VTLHVAVLGSGEPIVFVHGSFGRGATAWEQQTALAARWQLRIVDRCGHGASVPCTRNGLAEQGDDVAAALGDGAHLVGHSYGAVVALHAAAARPDAVRSLTLVEPPVFDLAGGDPDAEGVMERVAPVYRDGAAGVVPSDVSLARFSDALGFPSEASSLPPDVAQDVTATLREPLPWAIPVPLDRVRSAGTRVLVVSGGWPAGQMEPRIASTARAFARVSDLLEERLGAERLHVEEAHHGPHKETPDVFNKRLEEFLSQR